MGLATIKRTRRMRHGVAIGILLALTCGALATTALAQQQPPEEQIPGTVIRIDPAALPPPFATPSVGNPYIEVERPDPAPLQLPPGFVATIFAADLTHARWMALAPDGGVFLAEPRGAHVLLLRDRDGDGVAETRSVFAEGFRRPHGLAFHDGALYVADVRAVWSIPYDPLRGEAAGPRRQVTADNALGDDDGHWTRNILFAPAGDAFYVTVGSASNHDPEAPPRATVQKFAADGSAQETYASGLRNPVGIALKPGSDEVWVSVNERDGLGDHLPPDYMTRLEPGGFYGWPYFYTGANPQPDLAAPPGTPQPILPDILFKAHSAPLGLVFYDGAQFPEDYRGDAFVALHGSWNSGQPTGYMVARVPFDGGEPVGHYEPFLTGFWIGGLDQAVVWGRPAGLLVAADGSLLVADDVANVIWRVTYAP